MMNFREIQDRLIGAESVMRELSEGRVGPAPLRAQQLPYVHERGDMNGWGKKLYDKACKLLQEDANAFAQISAEFWEQFDPGPSPEDVSRAIAQKEWVWLVDDAAERRALQAWVRAMAGGMSFTRWCKRIEKVSVVTGRRRKNRAVEKILAQVGGKPDLHGENAGFDVLPVTPEIGDVSHTLPDDMSGSETSLNSWASSDAFQPFVVNREITCQGRVAVDHVQVTEREFDWAKKRNQRRRQREAAKRKREAA